MRYLSGWGIIASIVMASYLFAMPASAANQNLDKAKKQIKAGMYNEAISLLEMELNRLPDNPEIHYTLGICYFKNKRFYEADNRFQSAARLDKKYMPKIATLFNEAGSESLIKDMIGDAEGFFRLAVKYQPTLKPSISKQMISKAREYQNNKNLSSAQLTVEAAIDIDENVKGSACGYLEKMLSDVSDTVYLNKYSHFIARCKSHEESVANRLAKIARSAVEYDPEMMTAAANSCTSIRPDFHEEMSKLFLDLAAREYAQGRKKTFKSAMTSYGKMNPYVEPDDDRTKALQAVYLIESNERKRGIRQLNLLKGSKDDFASTISGYILSDPPPGEITVSRSCEPQRGNFILTLKKVLRKVEFTGDKRIRLHFEFTNISDGVLDVYFINKDKAYIVDNNGTRLYYTSEEFDKEGKKIRSEGMRISFDKGETVNYIATTNMVSQGATSFDIFDDNEAGDEITFYLDNVKIKEPFNSPEKIASLKTTAISPLSIGSGDVFVGHYECNNELNPYKLYVKVVRDDITYGVIEYQGKDVTVGSFTVQGKFLSGLRRIILEPKQWISHTKGDVMDKFDLTLSPDARSLVGVGVDTWCGAVRLVKEEKH